MLNRFRADGRSIVEIRSSPDTYGDAARATLEAIRGGADVIYQGVLLGDRPDGGTALKATSGTGCWIFIQYLPASAGQLTRA